MTNGQVCPEGAQVVPTSGGNITYNVIPVSRVQNLRINGQNTNYIPQTFQNSGDKSILMPEPVLQTQGVQLPTTAQNGQTLLRNVAQIGQSVKMNQGNMVQAFQVSMPVQQTVPVQVPVSTSVGHSVLQTVQTVQTIQDMRVVPGANVLHSQGQPITANVPTYMMSLLPTSIDSIAQEPSSSSDVPKMCEVHSEGEDVKIVGTEENDNQKAERNMVRPSKKDQNRPINNMQLMAKQVMKLKNIKNHLDQFHESMLKTIPVQAGRDIAAQTSSEVRNVDQGLGPSAIAATTIALNDTQQQLQQQQQLLLRLQQQQQQLLLRLQQQQQQQAVAIANFQLPNGQVVQGQINQIVAGAGGTTAWWPTLPANIQGVTRPVNGIQVQSLPIAGSQGIQVQSGPEEPLSNILAQQEQKDPSKWQVAVTDINPMSTPTQQHQVTGSGASVSAIDDISTTVTCTETPTASSTSTQLRRRRTFCRCRNCRDGRNIGSKNKEHICHFPDCNKIYSKTSQLRAHLRWHNGERPYICEFQHCGKRFVRSDELQRHRRIHTGEMRFQCDECWKRFARKDHFSKHVETHLKGSNRSEVLHKDIEDRGSNCDLDLTGEGVREGLCGDYFSNHLETHQKDSNRQEMFEDDTWEDTRNSIVT